MSQKPKSENTLAVIFWIIKLVYRLIPVITLSLLILQIIGAVTPSIVNYFYAKIIDSLVKSVNLRQNLWLTPFLIFLAFRILNSIVSHFTQVLIRVSNLHLDTKLRQVYLQKISTLDYQHFDSKQTTNLIAKVNDEYLWRTRQSLGDILSLMSALFSFLTTLAIISSHYWYLAILLLINQIPGFLTDRKWIHLDWQLHHHFGPQFKIANFIQNQLVSKNYLSELKISQSINFLTTKFNAVYNSLLTQRILNRQHKEPYELLFIFTDNIVLFICLLVIINDIVNGRLTIGLFTFYLNAMRSVGDYFSSFLNSFVSLTEQTMYLSEFKQVLELKPLIVDGDYQLKLTSPPTIEFKNVSFRYPHSRRYVFKNLNLTIHPGEELALVGVNGAGKTTLIKLLCRFYLPTSGKILINGINFKNIVSQSWYQYLSILFQEFTTYPNLTLKENIIIGQPLHPSSTAVKDALIKSEAIDFVNNYPHGLESMMGQRFGGEEPSWGQWQKIAIARVFYRHTPIMILDEPTASIDATSEAKIFSHLYRQSQDKTLIIVSHRFSTVRNAQRIIVLDKGKIVEEGSHQQLLKFNGLYAHSYHLQASGYQET